jgi:flagellar biosynthesis/type III secretory pathway M-ring protein FliF/YscJ
VGVGVNAASITVHDHPFKIDRLAAVRDTFEAIEAAKTRDVMLEWGGWAARALAIVAGFLLVRWFLRRAMVLPPEEEEEVVEIPAATAEDLRRREVATEVERMSHEEPEVVAALLRSWLSEKE